MQEKWTILTYCVDASYSSLALTKQAQITLDTDPAVQNTDIREEAANCVLTPLWDRPILKRDALGPHGTLCYDNEHWRDHIPRSKPEFYWDDGLDNDAQRTFFSRHIRTLRCVTSARAARSGLRPHL